MRLIDLWHGLWAMLSPRRALARVERELALEFGVAHVFLMSSGTAALRLTLEALKSVSGRRSVVLPAYTCFSVPGAVLAAGLRPTICDIDPGTFDFDRDRLDQSLNDDTLCVIAHHLFGVPSDVDSIRTVCQARGVLVVEDAAQAMGAEHNGRKLGTLGDVGIFSLGRGKNITCGSGGVIVTSSQEIASAIGHLYADITAPSIGEQLKDLCELIVMAVFIRPWLYWIPAAMPFLGLGRTIFPTKVPMRRLSGMKAGLLRRWRIALARSNRQRADAARYFSNRVRSRVEYEPSHPYLRFPVFASSAVQRDAICAESRRRGLGLSVAYPTPIDQIHEVRQVCNQATFPSANTVADRLLTIPTHHWLSEHDKEAIAALCRDLPAA
jgi:dTDP-4-amino-4,6-dideoxygalactose transaminase